jgi:hypothetical protein
MAHLYGPAARCNLQNGLVGLALLYPALWVEQIAPGHHGYPRVRSQFSDRPSKASWATRSRTRRRDHSPFLEFNSQTSAGISYYQVER